VTTLEAGTPYIIKWAKADGYDEASEETRDLKNPVFSGVTIDSDMHPYDTASPAVTTDERVRFLGTYKSTAFDAEDKSILLMGDGNKLYYPESGASIGAQRAYFKIGDGAALARQLTAFRINFGEDEATGIIEVHGSGSMVSGSDAWYTLDGRRLSQKPSRAHQQTLLAGSVDSVNSGDTGIGFGGGGSGPARARQRSGWDDWDE